mmetsp:Transcript_30769/g.68173  ORF Transcript_30769/g.68173 Transcript_30769/m.68173 type:complete len:208 (-) Transcript_30769:1880-2503(-)
MCTPSCASADSTSIASTRSTARSCSCPSGSPPLPGPVPPASRQSSSASSSGTRPACMACPTTMSRFRLMLLSSLLRASRASTVAACPQQCRQAYRVGTTCGELQVDSDSAAPGLDASWCSRRSTLPPTSASAAATGAGGAAAAAAADPGALPAATGAAAPSAAGALPSGLVSAAVAAEAVAEGVGAVAEAETACLALSASWVMSLGQ